MEEINMNQYELYQQALKYEKYMKLARLRAKRYYESHKEIIKERRIKKATITEHPSLSCDCGGRFQERFRSVHESTKKHKKYLENLEILKV